MNFPLNQKIFKLRLKHFIFCYHFSMEVNRKIPPGKVAFQPPEDSSPSLTNLVLEDYHLENSFREDAPQKITILTNF